jgi:hypothetical protein
VIFTSRASDDESYFERFGNQAHKVNDEGEDETSKLISRRTHFDRYGPLSSRYKFRRDSPYSYEELETNNNEGAGGKDSFDDARIRYILDNMKTRDVNGQTAAAAASTTTKPTTDTFNGKLIPCFIHCYFFLSPPSR